MVVVEQNYNTISLLISGSPFLKKKKSENKLVIAAEYAISLQIKITTHKPVTHNNQSQSLKIRMVQKLRYALQVYFMLE